jgi:hypothetical protein
VKRSILIILLSSFLLLVISCAGTAASRETTEVGEPAVMSEPAEPAEQKLPELPPEAVPDAGAIGPPEPADIADDIPVALHVPRLSDPRPVPPVEAQMEAPGAANMDIHADAADPASLPAPLPPAAPVKLSAAAETPSPAASVPAPERVPAPSSAAPPAPRTAPRAAAAPPSAATAAAETPEPQTETVSARPGDDITITLEGNGWIYMGAASDGPGNGSILVRFLDRSSGNGNSRFLFSTSGEGSAVLRFQLQNSAAGTRQLRSYSLTVAAEESGAAETEAGGASGVAAEAQPSPDRSHAELSEIIDRYRAGERRDSLRSLNELLEQYEGEKALDISLFRGLPEPAEGELPASFYSETFFDLLERRISAGVRGGEEDHVRFIEWLLSAVPAEQRDLYYFRLGRLFEEKLFPRDPAGAVHYYSKIRLEYPWSRYWNQAVERERFLRRHYLELR